MARTKGLGKTAALAGLGLLGARMLEDRHVAERLADNPSRIGGFDYAPDTRTAEEIIKNPTNLTDSALAKVYKASVDEYKNRRKAIGIPNAVKAGDGSPVETSEDFLTTTYKKKGGAVKGWGQARGARKAKVY
jgi:hypothetical protein